MTTDFDSGTPSLSDSSMDNTVKPECGDMRESAPSTSKGDDGSVTRDQTDVKTKIAYGLYGVGILLSFISFVGFVFALFVRGNAKPHDRGHLDMLVRTGWIGTLIFLVGFVVIMLLSVATKIEPMTGAIILFYAMAWTSLRVISGGLLALQNKPVTKTMWFGMFVL